MQIALIFGESEVSGHRSGAGREEQFGDLLQQAFDGAGAGQVKLDSVFVLGVAAEFGKNRTLRFSAAA